MPRLLLHHALTCSLPDVGGPPGDAPRDSDQHNGGSDQDYDGGAQHPDRGEQHYGGVDQHLGGDVRHFVDAGQHLGGGQPLMGGGNQLGAGGHQLAGRGGLGLLRWPLAPRSCALAGVEAEPPAASAALHSSPADVMAGFPAYGDVRGAQELQACHRFGCRAGRPKEQSCSHP